MKYTVFYGTQVFGEYAEWPGRVSNIPDGAYIRHNPSGHWFLIQWDQSTSINLCDIPKEIQALCLLLNI